jgi:tetraacyldisaccharide 4'-kinase
VICVGTLTVGGTGKTPLARWVVSVLRDAGRHPALVARGYARDELLLHRRWHPEVPVHADPDRVRAAQAAADAGADAIVLDDGFQHRRLARDLDLVVVSADRRFPGAMLPRGPQREPASALGRAGFVVITRRRARADEAARTAERVRRVAPDARLAQVRLAPVGWSTLDGNPAGPPPGDVLAVAGIADPAAFAAMVSDRTGGRADLLAFGDHHEYTARDLERIGRAAAGRPIATTEKDAVKLVEHADRLPDARVLALGVEVETGEPELRAAVLAAAGAARVGTALSGEAAS